ncbi:hypothetical protein [Cellulomonas sp. Root485]|uniref:hypothetical protein n=1 Tax=Cellulomonas sp. Root485 TaxID=1736546 RepID=UPI000AD6DFCC|nr:hypothetical protein [Cellulomonas sp. Root485]
MTTAIYVGLVALLVLCLARDIRRRPAGQSRIVTLKKPSRLSWVVMTLTVLTIVVLEAS